MITNDHIDTAIITVIGFILAVVFWGASALLFCL